MASSKTDREIIGSIWDRTRAETQRCPQCGGKLILVQVEPLTDTEDAYVPYKTVIECMVCSFSMNAESFTILGSIKDFDATHVNIGSWSMSGSRVLSHYEHLLDYDLLRKLKDTGELVEFLIVNKQVIQVIG